MKVLRAAIVVVAVALALTFTVACQDARMSLAEWIGATDKAAPAPFTEDVLCDPSSGSTCNAETLRETADVALRKAAERPGSVVRLWILGRSVESTRIVAETRSTAPRGTGRRARASYENTWVTDEEKAFAAAAAAALRKPVHRSPLAESIGLVALAPSVGARELTVITDALEVSDFGDFECGPLPKPATFARLLAKRQVLPERSLGGVTVRLCHVDLGAIDRGRCPVSLLRAAEIRTLWKTVLAGAGAKSIEIRQGGLDLISTTSTQGKD
jgi:hypothetical protein